MSTTVITNNNPALTNTVPAIFQNPAFGTIRVVKGADGEPWFVASDVAKALGYENPSRAVQEHCKHVKLFKPTNSVVLFKAPRGVLIIPKGDVYRLIARSKLPTAEKFEAWVFDEVLVSVDKTGGYLTATPDESPEAILARAVLVAQDTIARIKNKLAEASQTLAETTNALEEAKPKAALVDQAFARRSQGLLKLTDLARKLDGLNINRIKADLVRLGYFFRHCNLSPYRVYAKYRGTHFVEKYNDAYGSNDIYVTEAGAALVAKHYEQGELTLKKGY
jgi:prophage antirepressor-like protein